MADKDARIVYTTNQGEKIAIPQGNPIKVGDRVLMNHTPDGRLITTGNNPIKVGDKVVVLTTNQGEKVSISVEPPKISIDCIGGDNVLVKMTNTPLNTRINIPPTCTLEVNIIQTVHGWMGGNPDYGDWQTPGYHYQCATITNLAPDLCTPSGEYDQTLTFGKGGLYRLEYLGNIVENGFNNGHWFPFSCDITKGDICGGEGDAGGHVPLGVLGEVPEMDGIIYDFINEDGFIIITTNASETPELLDGFILSVTELDRGYADTASLEIKLTIPRTVAEAHPNLYELV